METGDQPAKIRPGYLPGKPPAMVQAIEKSIHPCPFRHHFFSQKKQIVLLAHPGTSLQCLGLWLRTIPGTVVSGMPVKDWSDDPVDDMHHDMERITETPETLKRFQRSILNGERCDETRMR